MSQRLKGDNMKRIPVYLSKEELEHISIRLRQVPWQGKISEEEKLRLLDRINEELATFELDAADQIVVE